jgi:rhodanese-related sulfurtransferase
MGRLGSLVKKVLARVTAGPPEPARAAPAAPRAAAASARAPAAPARPPEPEPAEPEREVEHPIPGALLLDIREPGELASGVAEGAMLLPMDLVPHHLADLPRDRPITIYCAAGARSFGVAHWLREQGFPQAWSLSGGVGVFSAVNVPVRPPPGMVPGTRVKLPPDALAGTVAVGPGVRGEVIEQRGDVVFVVIRDKQGFPVRVQAAVGLVVKG